MITVRRVKKGRRGTSTSSSGAYRKALSGHGLLGMLYRANFLRQVLVVAPPNGRLPIFLYISPTEFLENNIVLSGHCI